MKYSGIDLHSNNSVVVVIDESDRVVFERRLPNEIGRITMALAPYREELAGVVVESTYNWYWLVDGLQTAGYKVHLANTAAIKRYEGLKHSGDETDAAYLAQLLRLGILRTGYICPPEQRAVRDLARKRLQMVRGRTQHILAVENILARHTGARPKADEIKSWTEQSVPDLSLPQNVRLAITANAAVIQTFNAQVRTLEARLRQCVRPRPEMRLLKTTPGIADVLATTVMLELDTIERFAQVGHFASYCRCVDSIRLSNTKKKGEGNVKNGNKYLAWAFIEAANCARRYCPQAKRFYERKKAHTNNTIATKALAHKLARACYHMLKDKQPFDVKRCFG